MREFSLHSILDSFCKLTSVIHNLSLYSMQRMQHNGVHKTCYAAIGWARHDVISKGSWFQKRNRVVNYYFNFFGYDIHKRKNTNGKSYKKYYVLLNLISRIYLLIMGKSQIIMTRLLRKVFFQSPKSSTRTRERHQACLCPQGSRHNTLPLKLQIQY